MPPGGHASGNGYGQMPGLDANLYQHFVHSMAIAAGWPQGAAPVGKDVLVMVEGVQFQYQLTEDDLRMVFSRYGTVTAVNTSVPHGAVVSFSAVEDAARAVADLNGKALESVPGVLKVTFANAGGAPMPQMPQHMGRGRYDAAQAPMFLPVGPGYERVGHHGGGDSQIRKYTCRFDIGIPNDKEFQVARRVIGMKGANMKRIVQNSDAKLRLRGQGSGFLEGAQKVESAEPLHLCISCKDYHGYNGAVSEVEALLKRVYAEYRSHCEQNKLPFPENLKVQMREHPLLTSQREGQAQGPPQMPQMQQMPQLPAQCVPDRSGPGGGSGRSRNRMASDYSGASPMSFPNTPTPWAGAYAGLEYPVTGGTRFTDPFGGGVAEDGPARDPHWPPEGSDAPGKEEIERMIHQRNEARKVSNYAEADRIRTYLRNTGVALMDEPGRRGRGSEVTTWRYWHA